jgi:hypothetical protein
MAPVYGQGRRLRRMVDSGPRHTWPSGNELGVDMLGISVADRSSRTHQQLIRPTCHIHGWSPPATSRDGGRGRPRGGDNVEHAPVEPRIVVELGVDSAVEFGQWRHGARLLRPRHDLHPKDG